MWILKGTWLGLWLFGFGTMAFLFFTTYRNLRPSAAMGMSALAGHTIANPMWWTALVVCLVLGNAVARYWSGPRILWVALIVTGLVPAGFLALILTLTVRVMHARRGH